MSEAATIHSTTGVSKTATVDEGLPAPLLRVVGYCASCGTWDEHGPTCVSCGYDFAGSETARPLD